MSTQTTLSLGPMLASHPHPGQAQAVLAACVDACAACAATCTACADACLAEEMLAELVRCIRLNLDCADVCTATGALLARQTQPAGQILRRQLESCRTVCQVCAAECEKHAPMHEHCRICAESCRACEQACANMLGALPA
jgi:hypothetical protein